MRQDPLLICPGCEQEVRASPNAVTLCYIFEAHQGPDNERCPHSSRIVHYLHAIRPKPKTVK